MRRENYLSTWWGLLPHLALVIGLYILHSAWWALGLEGIILLVGLWIAFRRGFRPQAGTFAGRHLLLLVVHLLAGPVLLLLWQDQDPEVLRALLASIRVNRQTMWVAVLLHCTGVPLLEELFWRGALFKKGVGLYKPDILFALYHILILVLFLPFFLRLLSLVVLTGTAWLWRQEVERSNGVLPAILFHAAADLSLLFAVSILVR
jgi:membrane protease YdiL (CAAX protease family)